MPNNYPLVLQLVGAFFLLDLLVLTPMFNLYFGAAYQPKSWLNTAAGRTLVYTSWALGSLGLMFFPEHPSIRLVCVVGMFAVIRLFFITRRYDNIFRGCGAVGFMPHFVLLYAVLFEISFILDASGRATSAVFLLMSVEYGLIMICAGLYKALVGYMHRHGFEFALVNPVWSYHFRSIRKLKPQSNIFHFANLSAFISELIAGVLFLIPGYRIYGAALTILIFASLLPVLRLGRLFPIIISSCLLFFPDFGLSGGPVQPAFSVTVPAATAIFEALMYFGIVVLTIVKVMQYANLFFDKSFWPPLQRSLDYIAKVWPITLWRVFTADITNFFNRIRIRDLASGEETPFVDEGTYTWPRLGTFLHQYRFLQAAESVSLAATLNSLKYFASNRKIFNEKVIRYTKTLPPLPKGKAYVIEFVLIEKVADHFEYNAQTKFIVDLHAMEVTEVRSNDQSQGVVPTQFSPIRESVGYGSYAKQQQS